MYDDVIKKSIIDSLESKVNSIVELAIALASQGYFVNKSKRVKLEFSNILIHAFENIDVFSVEQQHKLDNLYNKVHTL